LVLRGHKVLLDADLARLYGVETKVLLQALKRKASRFSALRGTRKTGMSTDEIMHLLRGYGDDAGDLGFKA